MALCPLPSSRFLSLRFFSGVTLDGCKPAGVADIALLAGALAAAAAAHLRRDAAESDML